LVDAAPVSRYQTELDRDEHRIGSDEQADGGEAECSIDGGPSLNVGYGRAGGARRARLLPRDHRPGMPPFPYLAALAALAVGAALQGAVGFGGNLVAAPLLVLIDPTLVPGPLITANLVLNLAMIRRERPEGAWREAGWPSLGQIPGTVAGAAVLAAASTRNLTVFLAALTLGAVGVSLARVTPRRTPTTLTLAGILSGFMGTASGIGGPPVALLYRDATGVEIRSAISRFFLVSSLSSAVGLAAFGRFDLAILARGLLLVPGVVTGFVLSGPILGRIERRHVRRAVLVLSTASALLALARGLG
jgi:uncharacterized protein